MPQSFESFGLDSLPDTEAWKASSSSAPLRLQLSELEQAFVLEGRRVADVRSKWGLFALGRRVFLVRSRTKIPAYVCDFDSSFSLDRVFVNPLLETPPEAPWAETECHYQIASWVLGNFLGQVLPAPAIFEWFASVPNDVFSFEGCFDRKERLEAVRADYWSDVDRPSSFPSI